MEWFVVALYASPLAAIFANPRRKPTWRISEAFLEAAKGFYFNVDAFDISVNFTEFDYLQRGRRKQGQ